MSLTISIFGQSGRSSPYKLLCPSACLSVTVSFVCPFVGLHCGCVPPLCVCSFGNTVCVCLLGYIVGASPTVCPSVKDNLRWKTTFGGRQSLVEDTFSVRRPWVEVEDGLWWKKTFSGRHPLLDTCMLPVFLSQVICKCIWRPKLVIS